MPNPKYFDLDFRPDSYWYTIGTNSETATKVKGGLRRQTAKDLRELGIHDSVICSESLSREQLATVGRIHPMFMGGEYLPDLYPDEVEIARAIMKSVTMDVISIRAWRTKRRIFYRIVDEYEDEGASKYRLTQKTSTKPLTTRQMINMIDNAQGNGGLIGHARQMNYDYSGNAEDLFDFASISSEFYPQLSRWYDQANEEWLDARLFEATGMTKEERLAEEFRDRFLKRKRAINEPEKGWRRHNKKVLQAERSELELIHLNSEYEKRYQAQDSPTGEDEIKWRIQNEDRLKAQIQFESAVTSCLATAEWTMGPGMGGAHGAAIRRGSIKRFIENYLRSNGKPPSGAHLVQVICGANSFDIIVKFRYPSI